MLHAVDLDRRLSAHGGDLPPSEGHRYWALAPVGSPRKSAAIISFKQNLTSGLPIGSVGNR
jgi:hypothetical protein